MTEKKVEYLGVIVGDAGNVDIKIKHDGYHFRAFDVANGVIVGQPFMLLDDLLDNIHGELVGGQPDGGAELHPDGQGKGDAGGAEINPDEPPPGAGNYNPDTFARDENSGVIDVWLKKDPRNRVLLRGFLDNTGGKDVGITNLINCREYSDKRAFIAKGIIADGGPGTAPDLEGAEGAEGTGENAPASETEAAASETEAAVSETEEAVGETEAAAGDAGTAPGDPNAPPEDKAGKGGGKKDKSGKKK